MTSLSDTAFRLLQDEFSALDLTMGKTQAEALKTFMEVLEQGLRGQLPEKYHLLSLDPGMGKTSACIAFLKAWRLAGYQPASSILIALSTIDELTAFIDKAGLPTSDFGVLTSKPEMNALGLAREDHQDAKVLFTTQAQIRVRTKDTTFSEAVAFQYQGQPRPLRIWDEDILPSRERSVRVDSLAGLAFPLRSHFSDFIAKVEAFSAIANAKELGDILTIPEDLTLPFSRYEDALSRMSDERLRQALETVQVMAGKQVKVIPSDYTGKELLGVFRELPDDIAPLIVVDASARVREAYRIWEEYRGNVIRLKPAVNDYQQVYIRHWKRGAGKDVLTDSNALSEIAEAIVEEFGRAPEGEWLIVTRKDAVDDLMKAVNAHHLPLKEGNLHWLHWGKHRSTNKFADVENIVIVGQNRYSPSSYEGLSLASAGLPVTAKDYPDPDKLADGELKHHLLQAVCRASLRKANAQVAAHCNVYIIDSMNDAEAVLDELFPGHIFIRWKEDATVTTGRVKALMEVLREELIVKGASEVSKQAVRLAIGGLQPQNFRRLTQHPEFQGFLEWGDIEEKRHKFVREPTTMSPIDYD